MSSNSARILSRHLSRGVCGGFFVLMSLAPLRAQQVTIFPVPQNAGGVGGGGATAITLGPDGAMWFGGRNHIGRITLAGTITQFTLPTGNVVVNGIAAGPDGALWSTETNLNSLNTGLFTSQIGRITTSGSVAEFVIPTNNALPYAITAGADGALWFTESGADQVGRITTAGVITEYTAPSNTGGYTSQIVTGPDGSLWFNNGFAITKVTTQGVITQYKPNLGNQLLYAMGVGPSIYRFAPAVRR
jgi:virginiamycin B lyase